MTEHSGFDLLVTGTTTGAGVHLNPPRWLVPGALIFSEESADAGFTPAADFEELERRRYNDTEFIFLRFVPSAS